MARDFMSFIVVWTGKLSEIWPLWDIGYCPCPSRWTWVTWLHARAPCPVSDFQPDKLTFLVLHLTLGGSSSSPKTFFLGTISLGGITQHYRYLLVSIGHLVSMILLIFTHHLMGSKSKSSLFPNMASANFESSS